MSYVPPTLDTDYVAEAENASEYSEDERLLASRAEGRGGMPHRPPSTARSEPGADSPSWEADPLVLATAGTIGARLTSGDVASSSSSSGSRNRASSNAGKMTGKVLRDKLASRDWLRKATRSSKRERKQPLLSNASAGLLNLNVGTRDEAFMRAAQYIRVGLSGEHLKLEAMTDHQRNMYYLRKNRWYQLFVRLNILMQMLLVLIEPPSWRTAEDSEVERRSELGIGIISVIVQFADCWIRMRPFGWRVYFSYKWQLTNFILVIINAIDLFCTITFGTTFRFSRPLRPFLFIAQSRTLRRTAQVIGKALPPVLGVMLVYTFVILIWAYVGVLCFRGIYLYPDTIPQDRFDNIGQSMLAVFVLLTTENYPDVLYPAFDKSQWSFIFFSTFLIISLLFSGILLAVIYDSYKEQHKNFVVRGLIKEKRNFLAAFQVIDMNNDGTIDYEEWSYLLKVIHPEASETEVRLLFDTLDSDNNGCIDPDEFCMLADMLRWRLRPIRNHEPDRIQDTLSAFFRAMLVRRELAARAVRSVTFQYVSLALALINVILIVVHTDVGGHELLVTKYVFLALLALELAIKVAVLGTRYFWNSAWNKLDTMCLFGSILFLILFAAGAVPVFFNLTILRGFHVLRNLSAQADPTVFNVQSSEGPIPSTTSGGDAEGRHVSIQEPAAESDGDKESSEDDEAKESDGEHTDHTGSVNDDGHGVKRSASQHWTKHETSMYTEKTGSRPQSLLGRLLSLDESVFDMFLFTLRQSVFVLLSVGGMLIFAFYFFSIVGMELFAGQLDNLPDYENPEATFDNIGRAMLTNFQLMIINNWNDILYACIYRTSGYASIYFAAYFFVVVFLILELFSSMVIETFTRRVDPEHQQESFEVEVAPSDEVDFHKILVSRKRRWSRELVAEDLVHLNDELHVQSKLELEQKLQELRRERELEEQRLKREKMEAISSAQFARLKKNKSMTNLLRGNKTSGKAF